VAWEAVIAGGTWTARPCLRLVRLGFDTPRPADLDLDASVEYRITGLKSLDPHVRRWSARSLADMGRKAEAAVPALIRALDDPDPETRSWAEGLSQVVGPKTLPLLVSAMTAKSPRVRVLVIMVCGQLKGQGKAVTPALVKMLGDHDAVERGDPRFGGMKVCKAAVIALGNHGPSAAKAVPALTAALKSEDATLRWLAAEALGRIGPDAKQAIPALKQLLNDPDNVVRINAAESLKRIQR